jgi:hypothetical protein
MSKSDTIELLKTAKAVRIGYIGADSAVYLTPEFAAQLAEALETPEPITTETKGTQEFLDYLEAKSLGRTVGKPVCCQTYTAQS